jgi:4-alpha-glucanotransferase
MLASDSPSHTRHRIPEWLEERSAGLLLHISSLPSGFGIGNLGKCSHDLIDFLAESGFRFWQICPVGPTGFGDSPYQTFSSIAGNPYFIDWNPIVEAGLVDEGDLNSLRTLPDAHVDYGILYEKFWPVAEKAADRFVHNPSSLENLYGSYDTFLDEHASWLEPYALFQAIKADNGKKPWWLWPEEMRSHGKARQRPEKPTLAKDVHLHRFLQYVFLGQWKRLRDYAHSRNIRILGDLPIYVAPDCTEVWQRPDLFQLDITTGLPAAVAGVPPDYFNPDGQLWGNPLYD